MNYPKRFARLAKHCWVFGLHFVHGSLVMAGILVAGVLVFHFSHPDSGGLNFQALLPINSSIAAQAEAEAEVAFTPTTSSVVSAKTNASDMFAWTTEGKLSARYLPLAQYIARRYKVSQLVAEPLVAAAVREGKATGVDPLLILAVTSIESRFNPLAESGMGAQGLMQIIPRYHYDKISPQKGDVALFDPDENFRVGALILKEFIGSQDSLGSALQSYGGAKKDSSMYYSSRVLAELENLKQVMKENEVQLVSANVEKKDEKPTSLMP